MGHALNPEWDGAMEKMSYSYEREAFRDGFDRGVAGLPCEVCGGSERFDQDTFALTSPAREVALCEFDFYASNEGQRLIRTCKPCVEKRRLNTK